MVKSKTISDAIAQAKAVMKDKYNRNDLCITPINNRKRDEAITIEEMDKVVNSLVDETLYWAVIFMGL